MPLEYEFDETSMLHDTLREDGSLWACVHFGNYSEEREREAIYAFAEALLNQPPSDGVEICMDVHFRPALLLDSMIDMYECGDVICLEEKPKFDALRADLVAMLKKLDALEYGICGS